MNRKYKKLTPAILASIAIVASILAFAPIDQASTVHTTITAGTIGYACASEAVNFIGANDSADEDLITVTFTPEFLLMEVYMVHDAAGEPIGFDAITVDGAEYANLAFNTFEDITAGDYDGILSETSAGPFAIDAGAVISFTIDDDTDTAGGRPTVTDALTVTVCGLTEDAANFGADDIVVGITAG